MGRVAEIIIERDVDLVLPGSDADVVLLARLAESDRNLSRVCAVGTASVARMFQDKLATETFAAERGLRFAPMVCSDQGSFADDVWARSAPMDFR